MAVQQRYISFTLFTNFLDAAKKKLYIKMYKKGEILNLILDINQLTFFSPCSCI